MCLSGRHFRLCVGASVAVSRSGQLSWMHRRKVMGVWPLATFPSGLSRHKPSKKYRQTQIAGMASQGCVSVCAGSTETGNEGASCCFVAAA